MTDFPPGEWSPLLVGRHWPSNQSLAATHQAISSRGNIEINNNDYADKLLSAAEGPLAEQEGLTADDVREAFYQGVTIHRRIAEENGVKKNSYKTAHGNAVSVRQDLSELAIEGNQEIKEIYSSKEPTEIKIGRIVDAINKYQRQADLTATKYAANIIDAIQRVLDVEGIGQSARQFAMANDIDIDRLTTQPDRKVIEDHVRRVLDKRGSAMGLANEPRTSSGLTPTPAPPPAASPTASGSTMGVANEPRTSSGLTPTPAPPSAASPTVSGSTIGLTHKPQIPSGLEPGLASPVGGSVPRLPNTVSSVPPPTINASQAPASLLSAGSAASLPTAPLAPAPDASPAFTPQNLAQSFDTGMHAGAPMSTTASALPPMSPVYPTDPQSPLIAPTTPSAAAGVPVFDAPPPVEHVAYTAPVDATPEYVAAPTATAGPIAAAPPPPTGPLPAYGADLRPPISAASTPSASVSSPLPAAPASAPLHPAAGQAGVGQPAVVRQSPQVQPQSPSGVGTQAVMATTGGAIAGAVSADATGRVRLQRLVDAVARQQPWLGWTAGDRSDDTTLLVCDLASGWIPPGIDIPAVVQLLDPARRRGDLETLLGEATLAATYTPGQYLPEPDTDEPVATSPRPRRAPEVAELGWELSQATHWRDGLPRLAHTLAKAASTGTGVLDSEVELLHEHLATIGAQVLDTYPDNVDLAEVGNWQLLAAIDALISSDKAAANYHLAWFQATATAGHLAP